MRTELVLVAAVAVISGLGLLASSGPPRPVRSSVVLNKTPPRAPTDLAWNSWTLVPVPAQIGESPPAAHASDPALPPDPSHAAAAGIWATPAEFAESD